MNPDTIIGKATPKIVLYFKSSISLLVLRVPLNIRLRDEMR
jgi:hypothetical protein